jgi:hypothetical protein
MSDLSFCDGCFEDVVDCGVVVCQGMDVEFKIPEVNLYHRGCYATLDTVPRCIDCIDDPCFIRRKKLK